MAMKKRTSLMILLTRPMPKLPNYSITVSCIGIIKSHQKKRLSQENIILVPGYVFKSGVGERKVLEVFQGRKCAYLLDFCTFSQLLTDIKNYGKQREDLFGSRTHNAKVLLMQRLFDLICHKVRALGMMSSMAQLSGIGAVVDEDDEKIVLKA